jgi:hypothetical protein
MDDIRYQAYLDFKDAAQREDPEFILKTYGRVRCVLAKEERLLQRKLENPVHDRTGKPLNKRTIQKYRANVEQTKRHLQAKELAIRMLEKFGILGNERKSIDEILADYWPGKDIPIEDRAWIQALREIKKERDGWRAWRENIIHKIKTCQEDCPLIDFSKLIIQIY